MEYSAGGTKYLLWYVETKETARLLQVNTWDEIKKIVIEDNLYQQNSDDRLRNEFGCIQRRIKALPDDLIQLLIKSDINTAKLITLVGCMTSDLLFFDFMYEVYRIKLFMGDEVLTIGDWNVFFRNKQEQNEKVAKFTDATGAKLRQAYYKMLFEAGLLNGSVAEKKINKPYVDPDLRFVLQKNAMEKYLLVLTGER